MVAEAKQQIGPRFHLGKTVMTCGAQEELERLSENPEKLLKMHLQLKQGLLDKEDYQQNLDAVKRNPEGQLQQRIFSAYQIENVKFWVITEWDESVTTILLPSEY